MAKANKPVPEKLPEGLPGSLSKRKTPLPKGDTPDLHVYGNHVVCTTDTRGFPTPDNRNPLELVVNAPGGIIPLWDRNVTLRYRFNDESFELYFADPTAAKAEVLRLFGEAVSAWGDAAPVQFTQAEDATDFQIFMMQEANCNALGCVLASAFFPDSGRHNLRLYPTLFEQNRQEVIETLVHEIGHIFGLRHFFANISETSSPSKIFGQHNKVSIMNYGEDSRLTETDKSDLKKLYQMAWSGELTSIDHASITFVRPFSSMALSPQPAAFAARLARPAGSLSNISETGRRTSIDTPIQITIGGHKVTIE